MEKPNTNQTGSSLQDATDKHVFEASNFVKYLQWTHPLATAGSENLCEFGCMNGDLIEMRYRNKVAPSSYVGMCNDATTKETVKTKWEHLPWVSLATATLTDGGNDYSTFINIGADAVVALNVPISISAVDFLHYLQNFYMCGHQDATYTLLLPKSTDLLSEQYIVSVINTYFKITNKFGVGGSITDFIPVMNDSQKQFYQGLKGYYSTEIISAIMSPMFPDQCPQHLWKLKRKNSN